MDGLSEHIARLATPFTNAVMPAGRVYWLYILGALVMAFFVYRARTDRAHTAVGRRQADTFLSYCFPKAIYRHRSAVVDYRYYVANTLLRAFGWIPLMAVPTVADTAASLLTDVLGPVTPATASPAMRVGYTIAILVAMDAGLYVAHYLLHRVPILWEFHKVHHSAQVLTPITVFRMHPVDELVSSVFTALAVGTVVGGFAWGWGGPVREVLADGVNVGLFLFYAAGYNLRHSHIWLAYPRWLSWVLISPAQHQIHHSSCPVHFHTNLGFMFSFWDRLANTLYVPRVNEAPLEFGMGNGEDEDYGSVAALYFLPFKKAARVAAGQLRRAAGNG